MNEMNAKQLLLAGGPVMLPIILCGITALTIIISKWQYFNRLKNDVERFKSGTFSLVRENKIKAAVTFCETSTLPAAQVLKAGLLKFGASRPEIKEVLDHTTGLEIPQLEKGLIPLITIANTAPLFGVLGTVLGMTIIFQSIQSLNASMHTVTAADLAGGIWQALLTTLAGLLVAIPSFTAYNYFLNLTNNYINELARMNNELADLLTRLNESTNNNPIIDMPE